MSEENNDVQSEESGNGGSKKTGIIMTIVAILLCLCSDYIPGPVDDIVAMLVAAIGGRKLF